MSQPSFIFIVSDSLRADSLSFSGHPEAETPNLDKVANRSSVFLNHYAQAPVCGPSRNSFWTGRYPHSNGSLNNLAGLGAHERTFVEMLSENGYDCTSFGANHLQPEPSGFSKIVASRGKHPESSYKRYLDDQDLRQDPETIEDGDWPASPPHGTIAGDMKYQQDSYATKRAVDYIKNKSASPFFLYLGLKNPHPPYACDQKHYDIYKDKQLAVNDFKDPEKHLHPKLLERYNAANYKSLTRKDIQNIKSLYLGMISFVDEQVGRIMQVLEETGLDDNTHLVFTSDHADFCGDLNLFGKTDLPIKHLTHVPLLWKAPQGTANTIQDFTENIDLAPAFLELAGIEAPYYIEGRNLFNSTRNWAFSESADGHFNDRTQRYDKGAYYASYIDAEWHYIHATLPGHCALYHVSDDPLCHYNVIDENRSLATEIQTKLFNHIMSGTVPIQDNSVSSWKEYHEGAGIALEVWE
ncbi:MAG: sulfatase-like hydrolase/transferase [Candidatus Latescibacteria bacterium]|jgi:arylsulfatase|nr:sulfatase-like hydrolase/transferase [Candidatus Latescibacterota bacterium]